ncbi:MAG: hypothetical protein ACR2IF_08280 [Terriglobales bacterium]
MPIQVERSEFDPAVGYQYYLAFNTNGTLDEDEVFERVPVEVAISLCENGDLADVSFELPKRCRAEPALEYLNGSDNARYVEPRVFITLPGLSGDAVAAAAGRLEMDRTGRIIGMDILWSPGLVEEAEEKQA